MKLVDIGSDQLPGGALRHTYDTRQEGAWIIFTCADCPGHERRLNWQTGQVVSEGLSLATHSGLHIPMETLN